MMEYLKQLTTDILVPGSVAFIVAIGALKFLSKAIVRHQLQKETDRQKAELERRTEVLKAELSIYAHERNVAVDRLDDQKSTAIVTSFAAFHRWHELASAIAAGCPYTNDLPENQSVWYIEQVGKAQEELETASSAVTSNAIFFQESVFVLIRGIFCLCSDAVCDFQRRISKEAMSSQGNLENMLPAMQEAHQEYAQRFVERLQPAAASLSTVFRHLIGIEALPEGTTLTQLGKRMTEELGLNKD